MRGIDIWELAGFAQNPKQVEAWQKFRDGRFLLYGGAAGGGKSRFLRWCAVLYLVALHKKYGLRGVQVMLACEDYPSLKDRQISKIQAEFPKALGRLRQSDTREFVLDENYGGGIIALRNLDDPSKYLSAEFAGIFVDELSRNDRAMFDELRHRLRWPGVDRPKFAGATNPGGKGHGWVKKLWIDGASDPEAFDAELRPLGHEFNFVQAKASDNPFLPPSYSADLATLPEARRRALLDGDWDSFAGQYFTNFSKTRHCVAREDIKAQPWWPRWISIDWGYAHDSAVLWHTVDEQKHCTTYGEFTGRGLSPAMLGREIIGRNEGARIGAVYLDPSAFGQRFNESTIAELLSAVLHEAGLPRCVRAANDRIGGWMLMYQMLDSGHWKISEDCKELIRTLPALCHSEVSPEDVQKAAGDDAPDAARYGLYSHFRETRHVLPFKEQLAREMNSVSERLIAETGKPPTKTDMHLNSLEVIAKLQREAAPMRPRLLRGGQRPRAAMMNQMARAGFHRGTRYARNFRR
jgi:phage terminase large subunit